MGARPEQLNPNETSVQIGRYGWRLRIPRASILPAGKSIKYPGKNIGSGFLTDTGEPSADEQQAFEDSLAEIKQAELEASKDLHTRIGNCSLGENHGG